MVRLARLSNRDAKWYTLHEDRKSHLGRQGSGLVPELRSGPAFMGAGSALNHSD